jgi:predicted RNA-binding Zn-ribbon protein involved in translation (DUF1610 family)
MSRLTFHEIECPECGLKQKVNIYESVNVTHDPDLKEELLQGKINIFKCHKCGHQSIINNPLLYHDM